MCWVRRIETFNITHIFADFIIFATVVVIFVFCGLFVSKFGWAEQPQLINDSKFMNIIGFAIYAYEGIGVVIPVMEITEDKNKFGTVLIACTTSVFVLYLTFGEVCYFVFGPLLNAPIITSNLPKGNVVTWILKIALCINVVFTYPLILYPATIICEDYIFRSMKKS